MSSLRTGVRLALDWGEARIGVAACDRLGTIAYPAGTVAAGPDELLAVVRLVEEYGPVEVILGLPRSLSGAEGPAAAKTRIKAADLVAQLVLAGIQVDVRLVDERLTTVTASRRLSQGGKKVKDQRQIIDQAAAVAILEHALEIERSRGSAPGELVSTPDKGSSH